MIAFLIVSAVVIASALFTITASRPVHAVVGLLVNFVALAGLYLSLSAEFLAFVQILIYSGAILILFLFVIALLSSGVAPVSDGPDRLRGLRFGGAIGAAVALILFLRAIVQQPFTPTPRSDVAVGVIGAPDVFGSIADFGRALFTVDMLPFEVTAFVLLVAIVGVVLLAGDAPAPESLPPRRARRRSAEREPIVRTQP